MKVLNTKNEYTPEEIDYGLDKSRDLIPDYARILLAKSLAFLPTKVVDFISLDDKLDAETFPFSHFYFKKKAGFILVGGKIWRKSFINIVFTIAHEAAHGFKRQRSRTWNMTRQMKRPKGKKKLTEWRLNG